MMCFINLKFFPSTQNVDPNLRFFFAYHEYGEDMNFTVTLKHKHPNDRRISYANYSTTGGIHYEVIKADVLVINDGNEICTIENAHLSGYANQNCTRVSSILFGDVMLFVHELVIQTKKRTKLTYRDVYLSAEKVSLFQYSLDMKVLTGTIEGKLLLRVFKNESGESVVSLKSNTKFE